MNADRTSTSEHARLRRVRTDDLTDAELAAVRDILDAAFAGEGGGFADEDWEHAIGGMHFVLDREDEVVAHASVVEREIHVGDRPLRTGYVEAVATAPGRHGEGLGSRVMRDVSTYIDGEFELGALGTGRHSFYERLGWVTWRGPSFVRTPGGVRTTAEEDGYIMVLRTRSSPPLDLGAPISCEWRSGDVW